MTSWSLLVEGRTFSNRPNGHFRLNGPEGLSISVSSFQPLATNRENRETARRMAVNLLLMLNGGGQPAAEKAS